MAHSYRTLLGAILAGSSMLFFGACGGGGGGSSGGGGTPPAPVVLSNSTMTGTYTVACATGSISGPDAQTLFGTVVADGLGTLAPTFGLNDAGTVTPSSTGPAFPYSIAADGAANLDGILGGIRSDGSAAVAANVSNGGTPQICLLLRRDGAYSAATLSGNYHHCLFAVATSIASTVYTTTAQGKVAFDGVSALTYPDTTVNNGGALITAAGGPLSYSISAAGELVTTTLGGDGVGGATSSGDFAILGGATPSGPTPYVAVYLRASTGLTSSAFNGEYWAVGISSDPMSSNNYTSFQGTVTADGAGNMNYVSTMENTEGTITTPSGLDTYNVAADGTLNSGDRLGAITSNGDYAYLCGENAATGAPLLFVFIRK